MKQVERPDGVAGVPAVPLTEHATDDATDTAQQPEPRKGAPRDIPVRYASAIKTKEIHWLLRPLIMAGEIGLLGGATGEAKSQIASHLAAVMTAGKEFAPDQVPETSALGKVMYFVGERSIERVVVPRLKLAGANLDKVAVIGRGYRGKRLTAERMLEIVRAERDVRLVIVDHVGRFFPAANTAARVNDLLDPFERFADRNGTTFVLVAQRASGG